MPGELRNKKKEDAAAAAAVLAERGERRKAGHVEVADVYPRPCAYPVQAVLKLFLRFAKGSKWKHTRRRVYRRDNGEKTAKA